MRELDKAKAALQQGIKLHETLVVKFPTVAEYRRDLARAYNDLTGVYLRTGQAKEAEETCRRAVALQENLAADFPSVAGYRHDLGASLTDLGYLYLRIGRRQEGEHALRKALAIFQAMAKRKQPTLEVRRELGRTLHSLARLSLEKKKLREALQFLTEAIKHQEVVLEFNPRGQADRLALRNHYGLFGLVQLELGEYNSAATTAVKVQETLPEDGRGCFLGARILGRCAALAEKDAKVPADKRKAAAQEYADRAMAFLRDAVKKGFKDAKVVLTDADLSGLRSREDFRKLVSELKEKGGK
jgi:tetratricopeptide (TPR) repeat protein